MLKVKDQARYKPTGEVVTITKVGAVTYGILRDGEEFANTVPHEDVEMVSKDYGGCQPELNMPKVVQNLSLRFSQLKNASYRRAIEAFGHAEGLADWSPAEWTNALAGEVGELCNLTKKLGRGDANIKMEDIGKEIADVVIYADLIATRMGFKLEDLVRQKFNEVSDRRGSDIKL